MSMGNSMLNMRARNITQYTNESRLAFKPKGEEESCTCSENGRRARHSNQAFCDGHSGKPPLPLALKSCTDESFTDLEFGEFPSLISQQVEGLSPSSVDWEGVGNLDEGKKLYQEVQNPFLGPTEVSISERPELDHKSTRSLTYLFAICLGCPSMVMIKSPGKLLRECWTGSPARYDNGMIVTTCKKCERPSRKSGLPIYGNLPSISTEVQANKNLGPHLFKGSDLLKIPQIILGKVVDMIVEEERVKYMGREKIAQNLQEVDMVTSLNMSGVESGDPDEILLPCLLGNFF